MANFKHEWNGAEAERFARKRALEALTACLILCTNHAKQLLSVPGTGRKNGKKAGPRTASAPGDAPQKQTGRLRASVSWELDEATQTGRVGTNLDYGRDLEFGTKKGLAARPWLRRTLNECIEQVRRLLASWNQE